MGRRPLSADSCAEVMERIAQARDRMREQEYGALLVYGNNKLYGSLRYLSGYFTDRAGWISLTPRDVYLFEGAVLVLPLDGEPVLLVDPGLTLAKVPCVENVSVGSLTSSTEVGLNADNLARVLSDFVSDGRVGIETWERFPAPLYLALADALPAIEFQHSTLVEEMRLVKSPAEIELLRSAAAAGDRGHQAFLDALREGVGRTEIELIRIAEYALRTADPVYEDGCANSPSMISSGTRVADELLHAPQGDKRIRDRDIVHWDICSRHLGYSVDTSRTRIVGSATPAQTRAYEASLTIFDQVVAGAKPGVPASQLVQHACNVAREQGFELWARFLGHGVGIDVHERPDMGVEETALAENMTLAIEPRIEVGGYLVGHEDVVLVTAGGGESLNQFPKTPFEL
jgi:Xaa-Pro aminopeptidase